MGFTVRVAMGDWQGFTDLNCEKYEEVQEDADINWIFNGVVRMKRAYRKLYAPATTAGRLVPNVFQDTATLPAGGMLRALRSGGERAIRALETLPRRYCHSSAPVLQRLLRAAGIDEAVVKTTEDGGARCKLYRTG